MGVHDARVFQQRIRRGEVRIPEARDWLACGHQLLEAGCQRGHILGPEQAPDDQVALAVEELDLFLAENASG